MRSQARWFVVVVAAAALGCGGSGHGGSAGSGGGAGSGGAAAAGSGGAAGAGGGGGSQTATLFQTDDLMGTVKRFTISPNADPVLTATIAATAAVSVALSPTGELIVSAYNQSGVLSRFSSPFGTPTANGTFTIPALAQAEEMVVVDDELWIANYSGTTGSIARVAFDAQGVGSAMGTIAVSGDVRGLYWNAPTRDLFVSECCTTATILHFQVAADHSMTNLPAITGNGLSNPHGMQLTAWGELLVANAGANSILRFTLDSTGNATPNGTITGNGFNFDVALQFAPWGELYVANQGNCSYSRFTFDASHTAVPHGTPFVVPSTGRCDWPKIF